MARLADEILKGVSLPPWIIPGHEPGAEVALRKYAEYAQRVVTFDPVIDVSNVADYTWDQKETWSATNKDQFPCLTPPFKSFFMEYRRPPFFMHERDDLQTEEGKRRFGTMRQGRSNWVRAETAGWPVERYGVVFDSVDLHAGESFNDLPGPMMDSKTGESILAENIHPDSRWVLRGTLYIKQRGMKHAEGPMAYWIGGLDERGVLLRDAVVGYPAAHHFDPEERFYWTTMLGPTFIPALRAISYMHCKNVEQQTVTAPPKLSKAYAKKNGRPLLSYRTLVIQAMTKAGGKGNRNGGGGLKSHHIRRGHFGDYREKGLFGKESLKRIFWFDVTTVGSREVGEVIGDYAVEAPKEIA